MNNEKASTDEQSLRKLMRNSAAWERYPKYRPPTGNRHGGNSGGWFWAKLRTSLAGKYSWVAMVPNAEGKLEENEDWGKGDHTEEGGWAMELETNSIWCVEGDIVKLFLHPTEFIYFFEYRPFKKHAKLTGTNGIGGETETRPGQGWATIVTLDEDGDWIDTETEIRVFNSQSQIFASDGKRLQIAWFPQEGKWFVDVEGCS